MIRPWTELGFHRKEDELAAGKITRKEWAELQLRPVPKPAKADKVQVNMLVTIIYLDDQSDQEQGMEENFLQGGLGEAWEEEGIVRVRAWDNPIGEAIRGAGKGKIVMVRPRDGKKPFKIKVLKIQLPDLGELRERCEAAVEKRLKAA